MGKARDAVPEGTFAVGGGLMITALTTYVFLIVANQALPNKPYAALNTFWAFIFVAGPGLFLPLEQEVGRARRPPAGPGPRRRSARPPGRPPRRRSSPRPWSCSRSSLSPLYVDGAFHSDAVVVAALAIGLVGFAFMHLTRGTLSGNGRFRPYGIILAIDGTAKLVGGARPLVARRRERRRVRDVHRAVAVRRHRHRADRPARSARGRSRGAVLGAVDVRSAGCSPARCSCRRSATPCCSASACSRATATTEAGRARSTARSSSPGSRRCCSRPSRAPCCRSWRASPAPAATTTSAPGSSS